MRLLNALLRKWKILVAAVLVFAIGAFVFTKFFVTPMYKSDSIVYVKTTNSQLTYQTFTLAQDLVKTYAVLMKTDGILSDVVTQIEGKTNKEYSLSQIKSMLSVSGIDETEVMRISILCADPHDAQIIADQVVASAEPVIVETVNAQRFTVVTNATLPLSPASPNLTKNIMLAVIIALVLSGGIIVLIEILDKRIKDKQGLIGIIDAPVIGVIPTAN